MSIEADEQESAREGEGTEELATRNIPAGITRVAVRIKHHDPIPEVEWWDQPLLHDKTFYFPFDDIKD
jgi:U4/U6 small nuclear ribonucleoprotein PRP3